jgi:hypothetical protein
VTPVSASIISAGAITITAGGIITINATSINIGSAVLQTSAGEVDLTALAITSESAVNALT